MMESDSHPKTSKAWVEGGGEAEGAHQLKTISTDSEKQEKDPSVLEK